MRVIWNAEKGVDVDAGDGVNLEVMLSWWYSSRGKSDRDRVVVSCLLAVTEVRWYSKMNNERCAYDLARVLRRFRLRRRTRFFLHFALIVDNLEAVEENKLALWSSVRRHIAFSFSQMQPATGRCS